MAPGTILVRATVVSFHGEGEQGAERGKTGADNAWFFNSSFSMDALLAGIRLGTLTSAVLDDGPNAWIDVRPTGVFV